MVPATVRCVPPGFARGASHRRSTNEMAPLAIPSAVSRFSSTEVTLQSAVADRYGSDVLANKSAPKVRSTECAVELGMIVKDAQTGYVGAVVRIEYAEWTRGSARSHQTVLDRSRIPHRRPLGHPHRAATAAPKSTRTAWGSVAVPGARESRTGEPHLR